MDIGVVTLRGLVDKWLAPSSSIPARIVRFGRRQWDQRRYVCVEASRPTGNLAIFFFRHDDGTWRVYPPETARPMMEACRFAA